MIGAVIAFPVIATAQGVPAQPASPRLSVDEAVQEAVRANLDLLAEKQNVPIAKAREIQAALRPNPVFNFAWDYLDWLRRGLNALNSAGPSEWNTHVDYIVEGPGKRQRRIELARLVTSVAEYRFLDSIRVLGLNVRLAAVDFLLAKENLELARSNLRVFEDIVKVNQAKVQAGDLAGVELIRARVAEQQFQNAVQQAELKVRTSSNLLQQLLGRKTKDPAFDIAGSLKDQPVLLVFDEIKASALENRPDLLATEKDTDRARADIQLQRANAKPDYTLSLIYHHQYGYSNGRTFGTYLQFPMPLTNRNQGEILRAERETEQSSLRVAALQNSIATEVENAWQQYIATKNLLDRIRGRLLSEATQVRDITEFSYRRGEASLLEFLDAERAYNDAMQSFNDARADYTRSLYLLDAVSGKSVIQ